MESGAKKESVAGGLDLGAEAMTRGQFDVTLNFDRRSGKQRDRGHRRHGK